MSNRQSTVEPDGGWSNPAITPISPSRHLVKVRWSNPRYQPVGPYGQTPAFDTGAGPLLRDSCCVAAVLQGLCSPAWSIALDHMLSHQHIGLIDCHWQWMLDWAQGIDCPAWAGLLILGLGWILEACIVLQFLCWKAAQGAFVSCAWAKRLLYEAKSLLYYLQSSSIKPLF